MNQFIIDTIYETRNKQYTFKILENNRKGAQPTLAICIKSSGEYFDKGDYAAFESSGLYSQIERLGPYDLIITTA